MTEEDKCNIERIQKTAFRIIYKEKYESYDNALKLSNLSTLAERRSNLMLKFAKKCIENERTANMFPTNKLIQRRHTEKYHVPFARTERYRKSAIPAMTRMLNTL